MNFNLSSTLSVNLGYFLEYVQGRWNVDWAGGGSKNVESNGNLWKTKKSLPYACYCSTTMLTSKIINETIENLFQFDRDKPENSDDTVVKKTPLPLLSLFWQVRWQATAFRRPCLPLSAVTVSKHYVLRCLRSTVSCRGSETHDIVTWSEN